MPKRLVARRGSSVVAILALLAASIVAVLAAAPSSGAAAASSAGTYVAVGPVRVLDTRSGNGAPIAPVSGGHSLRLQIAGRDGVPVSGVGAVVLNVTVNEPTRQGFVTVYPDGQALPLASNLNFIAGQTVPNLVVVKLSTNGTVDLYLGGHGTAQLIADVSGYYLAGTPVTPGAVAALSPARLLDTRTGNGAPAAPVSGGRSVAVQVDGRGGVPADGVSAVFLNLTANAPTASGYVTVYADLAKPPSTSNLNYLAGQTVPNLVLAPVSFDGKVDLSVTSAGNTQLIADVAGYVLAGGPVQPGSTATVPPARLLDTRTGIGAPAGPVAGGHTVALSLFNGFGQLPMNNVSAVILNVTANAPTASGYVTVYGIGVAQPTTSSLNFVRGQTVPNLVIAPVGPNGTVYLSVASAGSVHLIADIFGYVLTGDPAQQLGIQWGIPHTVDGALLPSVSCPTTTFCMAVDGGGRAITFNGSVWSTPIPVSANFRAARVACSSPTYCIALIPTGAQLATFDGSAWSAPFKLDPAATTTYGFSAWSCAPSHLCVISELTRVFTSAGGAWSGPTLFANAVTGVSCVSGTFCMAVDSAGNYLTYNGSAWTSAQPIPPNAAPQCGGQSCQLYVGCASSTFCVTTSDQGGYSALFNGSGWSRLPPILTNGIFGSITCPGAGTCVIRGDTGALTLVNGQWTPPTAPDPRFITTAISCPTPHYCVAVGGTTAEIGTQP